MGAFKLGKMTFGSLFKKPETVLYPVVTKPQPKGLKGHIVVDAQDCILCGMCDRSCTTDCITVDKAQRTWSINAFGCVQCGYCTTVCPKKCLHMDPNYHPASTEIAETVVTIPEQPKAAKAQAAKPAEDKPQDKVANEAQVEIKPTETVKVEAAPAQELPAHADAQVEALLSMMGEDSAKRVRDALNK